jgi:putative phage-type endonuclease
MVTVAEAKIIEEETRAQSACKKWHTEREWRITASMFGDIVKATDRRELELLALTILSPPKLSSPAITHGRTYEETARSELEERLNKSVQKCGLFVSTEHPFLAASPDGLIGGDTIVEIKCPFGGRDVIPTAGKAFPFLVKKPDGSVGLKQNHNYYYQVQGQMAIAKAKMCYFVVYTFRDMLVEKILFDANLFNNVMLPKLQDFYKSVYCPFVASRL